jgi:formylglycine-generating enzyme required for sulfatase activity
MCSSFFCDDGSEAISAVGRCESYRFGVCDVIGNVSEWIEDCAGPIVRAAYPIDGRPWFGGLFLSRFSVNWIFFAFRWFFVNLSCVKKKTGYCPRLTVAG